MLEASEEHNRSALDEVSTVMVHLHKEQYGRGPTHARSYFAGPDLLICVLREVLLPAELKLVELGQHGRVTDTRTSYQTATKGEFTTAIEKILYRKVIAFASGIDPTNDVVFESFLLASQE